MRACSSRGQHMMPLRSSMWPMPGRPPGPAPRAARVDRILSSGMAEPSCAPGCGGRCPRCRGWPGDQAVNRTVSRPERGSRGRSQIEPEGWQVRFGAFLYLQTPRSIHSSKMSWCISGVPALVYAKKYAKEGLKCQSNHGQGMVQTWRTPASGGRPAPGRPGWRGAEEADGGAVIPAGSPSPGPRLRCAAARLLAVRVPVGGPGRGDLQGPLRFEVALAPGPSPPSGEGVMGQDGRRGKPCRGDPLEACERERDPGRTPQKGSGALRLVEHTGPMEGGMAGARCPPGSPGSAILSLIDNKKDPPTPGILAGAGGSSCLFLSC